LKNADVSMHTVNLLDNNFQGNAMGGEFLIGDGASFGAFSTTPHPKGK
jgi:hypothetical protein